ncbi:phage tail assembly protein [Vibrio sp. AK197]|uniref:Phage tail assembly protein n=1 Tax=Vibrio olivae TaxID=1243002 RepID=A0ABV5HR19_9VIBR
MTYPVETVDIKLIYPVFFEGNQVETLKVRRPKVRDQLIADKQNANEADKEIHLMSLLAGVDQALIQELDLDDYGQLQEAIVGFRKKGSQSETSNAE